MNVDKIIQELSRNEKRVLLTLQQLNGSGSPEKIMETGSFSQQVEVMNAASWLQSKQLATVKEYIKTVYALDQEGKYFQKEGLPEKRVIQWLSTHNKKASLKELSSVLKPYEIPIAIGWVKRKGWANISKEQGETVLNLTDKGLEAVDQKTDEEQLLDTLADHPFIEIDEKRYEPLVKRSNVLKVKEMITGEISLTDQGWEVVKQGITLNEEITQITSEIIKNKSWESTPIRPYDVSTFAPSIQGGKPHPLVQLIDKVRAIMLRMGFSEIEGNFVESVFWNMDVLFIPQDHPAREMQDTLYCKKPKSVEIGDEKLVEIIKSVHEHGGETGSDGWGYDFSKDEGKKALLRTHTTVNTIRYLYHHPEPPAKVFSIGQVFRKENIDSTHLPLFYQIEGIIHDANVSFRQLIGVLYELYKQMGFEKIRFRPAYFPYTEPSMEVEVFWNNQWMELGGSGMFRPEVTEPLGIKTPVLAWGLGLERLAMLKFGLTDIRQLYQSDFDWLKNQPLL
jgi:phenylalanyl-tRNA synthetase alpha chain